MTTILLVEDDPALRRALRTMMRSRDLDVLDVATGEDAIVAASGGAADVVVLDLGLPDIDGIDVLRRIRSFSAVPVIVLTAHHQQSEKIRALDAGADDYVTKPFDTEELLARIRATLRRVPQAAPAPTFVRVDDVEIDLARRRVTRAARPSTSRVPSSRCSSCSCAIPASCSRRSTCCARCGDRATAARATTCASTSASSARSSATTPPIRVSSSPSRVSATAGSPAKRSNR